jgi:hypothetical protein
MQALTIPIVLFYHNAKIVYHIFHDKSIKRQWAKAAGLLQNHRRFSISAVSPGCKFSNVYYVTTPNFARLHSFLRYKKDKTLSFVFFIKLSAACASAAGTPAAEPSAGSASAKRPWSSRSPRPSWPARAEPSGEMGAAPVKTAPSENKRVVYDGGNNHARTAVEPPVPAVSDIVEEHDE